MTAIILDTAVFVDIRKDGNVFAVQTNALTEAAFWESFASTFERFLEGHIGDMAFQIEGVMPLVFEVVAKLRGYKSSCKEQRVLWAGETNWASDKRAEHDAWLLEFIEQRGDVKRGVEFSQSAAFEALGYRGVSDQSVRDAADRIGVVRDKTKWSYQEATIEGA